MKSNLKKIDEFVELLAKTKVSSNVFNQYDYKTKANAVRRKNLELYLQLVALKNPNTILVGEAPSYQGTRFTGVPFASEYHLLDASSEITFFKNKKGFAKTNESSKMLREPTSTIMQKTLQTLNYRPLLWAAFPFHPFVKGIPLSNRKPTAEELKQGKIILERLVKIFEIKNFVAVGNVASETLSKLDIKHIKVRHPSHGGANQFAAGLKTYLKKIG